MFGVPIRSIQRILGSLVMETTMFSALAGYLLRVSCSCHVRMDLARVVNSVIREFRDVMNCICRRVVSVSLAACHRGPLRVDIIRAPCGSLV